MIWLFVSNFSKILALFSFESSFFFKYSSSLERFALRFSVIIFLIIVLNSVRNEVILILFAFNRRIKSFFLFCGIFDLDTLLINVFLVCFSLFATILLILVRSVLRSASFELNLFSIFILTSLDKFFEFIYCFKVSLLAIFFWLSCSRLIFCASFWRFFRFLKFPTSYRWMKFVLFSLPNLSSLRKVLNAFRSALFPLFRRTLSSSLISLFMVFIFAFSVFNLFMNDCLLFWGRTVSFKKVWSSCLRAFKTVAPFTCFASLINLLTSRLPLVNFCMIAFLFFWFKFIPLRLVLSCVRRRPMASFFTEFIVTFSFLNFWTSLFLFVWLIFSGVKKDRRFSETILRFWLIRFFSSSFTLLSKLVRFVFMFIWLMKPSLSALFRLMFEIILRKIFLFSSICVSRALAFICMASWMRRSMFAPFRLARWRK